MAIEIERKFLVSNDGWHGLAPGVLYCQGYLNSCKDRTVRIRMQGDDTAFLTIKGAGNGISRCEYEYPIPVADCRHMLETMAEQPVIEKKRYRISCAGMLWEVDEFFGANAGLVLAEIELQHEDQPFTKPDWVGKEVTGDPRYYNANLIANPYSLWKNTL